MRGFRYMHRCSHRFSSGDDERIVESSELFLTEGRSTAVLIDGANVLDILEVRVKDYEYTRVDPSAYDEYDRVITYDDADHGEGFFDDLNDGRVDYGQFFLPGKSVSEPIPPALYRQFLHNRIEFLAGPPKSFFATFKIRYRPEPNATHVPAECPRCGGRGWFIDLVDERGDYHQADGAHHVVQDFIRILLTDKGDSRLDTDAGSRLRTIMGRALTPDALEVEVAAMVSEATEQYLRAQADTDTSDYAPEEVLYQVTLAGITQDPDDARRHRVTLVFVTGAGEKGFVLNY